MNLPNKITIFRVILIPVFLILLMVPGIPLGKWIAIFVFIIASLSDMVDGKIARKYHLVTDFGKFMDPLADKLLVCSALIALIDLDMIPAWAVIIIIAREFTISGFRLVASDNGRVIAASMWGKVKTTVQMITIIYLLVMVAADLKIKALTIVGNVLIFIEVALTFISLIDYMVKYKDVIYTSI